MGLRLAAQVARRLVPGFSMALTRLEVAETLLLAAPRAHPAVVSLSHSPTGVRQQEVEERQTQEGRRGERLVGVGCLPW